MSMKTILVPMEKHDGMQSVLETALLLARGYDSYIEGFSLRWTPVDFAVGDTVGAFPVEPYKREMAAQAQRARQTFETFMQKSGVPRSTERTKSLSFGWINAPLEGETFVGNYGRAFDVIVMNRPDVNSSPQSIANVGIGHNAIVLAVPILTSTRRPDTNFPPHSASLTTSKTRTRITRTASTCMWIGVRRNS